jgi:hypothetical protein
MPLSRTDLLGQINSTTGTNLGTGNFVTGSFSTLSGSYMLIGVAATENSGSAPSATDMTVTSSTGVTVTPVLRLTVGGSFATYVGIFAAAVVTGASGTLTVSFAGRTMSMAGVSVSAWTGYDTGTPLGVNGSNSQSGGFTTPNPASITLSGAPAATSQVWGIVAADKNTADITPGTSAGWTEITDLFNPSAINAGFESEFRGGSTSPTVLWDDIRPGGGALFNWVAAAVEVRAQTTTEVDLAANLTATGGMSATLLDQVPLSAGFTATGGMSATLTREANLAAALTATGSMSATLGPDTEFLAAHFTATGGMSAALTVPTTGPVDPIGTPVANALLACLTEQMNTLPSPPAKIELRVGSETGPLIGPNVDECCSGLAWVRIVNIYPSWDSFPGPDNTWLPCGPLAYAVVLEMGTAFCMPWSDSEEGFDNVDPPSTSDWGTAFTTLMQHQTLMRRAAACCFPYTQRRAVGEWSPKPVEGGCTGGTLLVTVSVMAPCGDC